MLNLWWNWEYSSKIILCWHAFKRELKFTFKTTFTMPPRREIIFLLLILIQLACSMVVWEPPSIDDVCSSDTFYQCLRWDITSGNSNCPDGSGICLRLQGNSGTNQGLCYIRSLSTIGYYNISLQYGAQIELDSDEFIYVSYKTDGWNDSISTYQRLKTYSKDDNANIYTEIIPLPNAINITSLSFGWEMIDTSGTGGILSTLYVIIYLSCLWMEKRNTNQTKFG